MNLVFDLDGVICHGQRPLANVVEFMQWLKTKGHNITIWTTRPNTLEEKVATETWLETEQIPFDRLLFDRPKSPIYVEETPPNAKYHKRVGDNDIISMLFDEWKDGLC